MQKNKKVFLIISIILFMVAANYFIQPAENEEVTPHDSEELTKLKKEFNQLSIDYLNLQGENEKLQNEITNLYESNFETYKRIYETDFADEFIGESAEIIHKELEEDKLILLIGDERGVQLNVWLKGEDFPYSNEFTTLNPENGWSWHGGSYLGLNVNFYSGVITDEKIEHVRLLHDDEVHNASIVKINENLHIWYSKFEYQEKRINEHNEIKIEALDNKEAIVREEVFEGATGG